MQEPENIRQIIDMRTSKAEPQMYLEDPCRDWPYLYVLAQFYCFRIGAALDEWAAASHQCFNMIVWHGRLTQLWKGVPLNPPNPSFFMHLRRLVCRRTSPSVMIIVVRR